MLPLKPFFLFLSFLLACPLWAAPTPPKLVVYAYDSFLAKGGLGPKIIPLFEKQCGCRVEAVSAGDAGQLLTRVQLDEKRKKPTAHVVLGIDGPTWQLFESHADLWASWTPKGYDKINPQTKRKPGFLPFDYGILTFIQDNKVLKKMGLPSPKSIKDLMDPKWKRNILLQDPRTSTPGLSFILYLKQLFPNAFEDNLKKMKTQWLTLSPGWDAAYGLFLKGEAPLVWSYVTSQAYHEEDGDVPTEKRPRRFEAVMLAEGLPMQIEGAAMVKATIKTDAERKLAQSFLEFLISPQVQELIPKHNWMYPVLEQVPLPQSFKHLPKPAKIISLTEKRNEIDDLMKRWLRAMH